MITNEQISTCTKLLMCEFVYKCGYGDWQHTIVLLPQEWPGRRSESRSLDFQKEGKRTMNQCNVYKLYKGYERSSNKIDMT